MILDLAGGGAARRNLERQRAARAARARRIVARGNGHAHKVREARPSSDRDIAAVVEILSRRLDRPTTARLVAALLYVDEQAARLALVLADHGGIAKRAGGTTTSRPRANTAAGRAQAAEELAYRAGFVVNAARRLSGLEGDDLDVALRREKAYYAAHVRARRSRMAAAADNAEQAAVVGPRLGWYAARDDRTTPECAAAHRTNFDALTGPKIGRPGTLHGGTCRCVAGPPFPGARSTDSATRRFWR